MAESDELEDIREQKREELMSKLSGDDETAKNDQQTDSAPSEPIHITDPSHFNEVTSQYDVVLTDFYADWCGPCKMLEPIVADIAQETDAAVAKVDVDAQQQLAAEYGVRGVPTMVLFSGGEMAERIVGVREKHQLKQLISRLS